jgi:hypothetical protein
MQYANELFFTVTASLLFGLALDSFFLLKINRITKPESFLGWGA